MQIIQIILKLPRHFRHLRKMVFGDFDFAFFVFIAFEFGEANCCLED